MVIDAQDEETILEHASADDLETLEPLFDPVSPAEHEHRRRIEIVAAIALWILTFFLASHSNISSDAIANGDSASGELQIVSFLGLFIILFSNETIANYTGFNIFVSWLPINKPTPLWLLRFIGWVFLVGVAIIFVFF